ncbi:MAG: GNAT family N-acetyltransferase [Clostridia bacterium]|nr:GNAT family N-acetyltransferase [Clostridia bacterium]
MIRIRHVQSEDRIFWFGLDKHLSQKEFNNKVSSKSGYVLLADDMPVGLLRYSLFWDSIPFCNMLYIDARYQRKGYGKKLMAHWEEEMKAQGYERLLTSTQADEEAQHFYRKLGYQDCGGLVMDVPGPMELILMKAI